MGSTFAACDSVPALPCCVSELLAIEALCDSQLRCILLCAVSPPLDVCSLFDAGISCICIMGQDDDRVMSGFCFRLRSEAFGFPSERHDVQGFKGFGLVLLLDMLSHLFHIKAGEVEVLGGDSVDDDSVFGFANGCSFVGRGPVHVS